MVGPILGTALGLGFLLFIHEFGHFVVAKRAGVKVEVFSLGIAHFICSWTWRGTVYALSWLPLGGYVRMAGQQDLAPPPGHKPKPWEYGAKRPVVRMAIISAGVIMNFIGGWLCYSGSFMVGRDVEPPMVGDLDPENPLHKLELDAGLQPGDRILAVDGDRVHTRIGLDMRIARISPGSRVALTIKRDGRALPEPVTLTTMRRMEGISTLVMLLDSTRAKQPITIRAGFAAERRLIVTARPGVLEMEVFRDWNRIFEPGDVVETVNGRPCRSEAELKKILAASGGKPLKVALSGPDGSARQVTVPVSGHCLIGVVLDTTGSETKVTKVSKVVPDSPASRAGIRPGDTLYLQQDRTPCKGGEFYAAVQRSQGRPMPVIVEGQDGRFRSIRITAQVKRWYADPGRKLNYDAPVPWGNSQVVTRVDPASMAEAKGLKPESIILDIEMESDPSRPLYMTWVHRGRKRGPHRLDPVEEGSSIRWVRDRQEPLQLGVGESLAAGWSQTAETVLSTTVILRKVMSREVSPGKTLSGPISIVRVAYQSAQKGFGRMLWLLGLIGVSLAFFNLLPIPVLDGGHLVFLGYEVIARRPPPPRVVEVAQYAGLLLILGLFVFVFGNDIFRWVKGT